MSKYIYNCFVLLETFKCVIIKIWSKYERRMNEEKGFNVKFSVGCSRGYCN